MAKFRFYQDKEVKIWVRDYYTVEADSMEDAIGFIRERDVDMAELEYRYPDKVTWERRDTDSIAEDGDLYRFSISTNDVDGKYDEEILYKTL